eukprot:TRINITY_DN71713_c0_g1_i1.p1 TRINITY_DN71713_c0_g1~~TRINITY_DN71713_c0_g1_i1.p1  ORF type:complete len:274 (+),score=24.68 TRINITY_DN71713_c0_g1_i1:128-949(+)
MIFTIHPETMRIVAYLGFWSMVLLAIIVHSVHVDIDMNATPLVKTFGYNNICIFWDFSPSREIAAMYYPLVEYPLVAYVLLTFLQYKASVEKGLVPIWFYRFSAVIMSVQLVLFAWFRMIFVIDGFIDIVGHTMGFLGLQLGLILNSLHNAIYNHMIGTTLDSLRGFKWTRIGVTGTRILIWSRVVLLTAVTVVNLVLAFTIFGGTPIVDVKTTSGSTFAKSMDMLWMFLAAVAPLPLAAVQRLSEPGLQFEMSMYDATPRNDKAPAEGAVGV